MIDLGEKEKELVLSAFGYKIIDGIIQTKKGKIVICRYSKEPVRFKDVAFMPLAGKYILFNYSALDFSTYLEEVERLGV